jgi:hypothetical protein
MNMLENYVGCAETVGLILPEELSDRRLPCLPLPGTRFAACQTISKNVRIASKMPSVFQSKTIVRTMIHIVVKSFVPPASRSPRYPILMATVAYAPSTVRGVRLPRLTAVLLLSTVKMMTTNQEVQHLEAEFVNYSWTESWNTTYYSRPFPRFSPFVLL